RPPCVALLPYTTLFRSGIKPEQYETAMRQRESVLSLPDVRDALSSGRAEVSAFWNDQETGLLCRCRPDWVHPVGDDAVILLDLRSEEHTSELQSRENLV